MNLLSQYKLLILGLIIGAIGGYLYYHFAGCTGGACPIISKPLNSSLYGAVMGGLLFSSFKKDK